MGEIIRNRIRAMVFSLLVLGFSTAMAEDGKALLPNGNLETPDATGKWPVGWQKGPVGINWEIEDGNHFLRFKQTTPGAMLRLYVPVDIPAGAKGLRFSFRVRFKDIAAGEKPWFDAYFKLNYKDASGKVMEPDPCDFHFSGTSKGSVDEKQKITWVEKSLVMPVPDGATKLEFWPSLFNAKAGILDIDDVNVVVASDEETTKAIEHKKAMTEHPNPPSETPNPEKWPSELFVAGNQIQTKDGKNVWLQGVYICSLEWSPRGEGGVVYSAKVAIEDWKSNVIRLALMDDYWFGKSDRQNDGGTEYRALVNDIVSFASNRGAYVVLDLHHYRAIKEEHLKFWKEVAAKYKNHPAVLFDIINEPYDISWEIWRNGGFVEEKGKPADIDAVLTADQKSKKLSGFSSPGMQAAVNAIRETGARNIIVAGGIDWSGDLSGIANGYALDEKGGNGIMYSWHIYWWHKNWQGRVLETTVKYPILVGECGASVNKMSFIPAKDHDDPFEWSPDFIGLVQKYKLNWTASLFHVNAAPNMIQDWNYTPTPAWGAFVKDALSGKQFEMKKTR
ncbi:MAG TPA: hypothetical protein DCZ94_18700 [Lentisphaeria bacterium]|nr:MAG: hypothetical protein A2X48_05970 [Lentisphaerae bacterium GWF2_49_21]HBC88976.1 hypothetical protein [Lentisphaeria bacterium]